jgi:hypothetical protein
MAHVVIPTKSNIAGLQAQLAILVQDPAVDRIIVVCDGPSARARMEQLDSHLYAMPWFTEVPEGVGIHRMWNHALDLLLTGPSGRQDIPVLFLNDDVDINEATVVGLEHCLDYHPEVGLVAPVYGNYTYPYPYHQVWDTCRGRYDGSGGMAGFCMMLRGNLAKRWRFNEEMKWWYGDDDLTDWVNWHGYKTVVTPAATCANNTSWTISNDPPSNFADIVRNDAAIYERIIHERHSGSVHPVDSAS